MQLHRVQIENLKRFASDAQSLDIELRNERNPEARAPGWTVIAGPNGAGKTTVLQCIAAALMSQGAFQAVANGELPRWPRIGTDRGRVAIRCSGDRFTDALEPGFVEARLAERWTLDLGFVLESMGRRVSRYDFAQLPPMLFERLAASDDERLRASAQISRNAEMSSGSAPVLQALAAFGLGPWTENGRGWFCVGYGTHRRIEGQPGSEGESRSARLLSLFDDRVTFAGAIEWLTNLELGASKGNEPNRRLSQQLSDGAKALLNDGLLPRKAKVARVDNKGLWIKLPGANEEILLQQLGEGYRVVAGLVLDLYRRLALSLDDESAPNIVTWQKKTPVVLHEGVVLLDEAEQHLHPAWQKELGFWLKRRFPNFQFIVTTHSPFICEAADCLVRLSASGAKGPAAETLSGPEFWTIVNGESDDIALSRLFGLEGTASREAIELRESVARREGRLLRGELPPEEVELLERDTLRLPDAGTAFYQKALARRRERKP